MKRIGFIIILCFIVSTLHTGPLEGMGYHKKTSGYNLILITIDTLRADHLGCYGYDEIKTPVIDKLAQDGVTFTQAFTPVPVTLPSHVTIMTGLYPIQHGIRNNGNYILGPDALTLAELLKTHGYKTCACVGAFVLDSLFGLDQGFDFYEDSLPKEGAGATLLENERRAEAVTKAGINWLSQNKDAPFFLWLHYFDPHAIYLPPSPYDQEYKGRLYDGEIAYTDKCIGDMLEGVKQMGLMEKTIIILTSDHGEGLGDHGEPSHAIFIYDTTLHIPLIIKAPGNVLPKGKKVSAMVSLIDIFPTILNLFSIPYKKTIDETVLDRLKGKDLMPLMTGRASSLHESLLCASLYPELNFGWSRLEGIRTPQWKYISAPKPELYSLNEDPREEKNLYSTDAQIWQERLERLKASLGSDKDDPVKLDVKVKKRLESLGYVWHEPSKGNGKRPDPKDMVILMEHIDRGVSFIYLGLLKQASTEFQKILDVNPDNASALFYLASVKEKMGHLEEAEQLYRELLAISPNYLDVHNHLGVIYHMQGKLDKALEEFELAIEQARYPEVYYNLSVIRRLKKDYKGSVDAAQEALTLDPNYADALNQLGQLALDKGDLQEAKTYFKKTLDIEPDHLESHNNLGVVYYQEGKDDEAIKELEKALSIDPNSPEAHNNLGSIYLTKGLYEEAEDAFKKALSFKPDYTEGLINLGLVFYYKKEYAMAQDIYHKVILTNPDIPVVWVYMGLTQLANTKYQQAYDAFEKALKIGADSANIFLYLGQASVGLKRYDAAMRFWQEGLNNEPDNKELHFKMAQLLYDLGNVTEAFIEWEKVSQIDPSETLALKNMATVRFQEGRYDEAISLWEKSLQADPNLDESYLHIGTAYLRQNKIEESLSVLHKLLERKPNHIEALINLGTVYYQKGDLHQAIKTWQQAGYLDSENPTIHYNLALSFFSLGDYQQSLQEVKEVLRIDPSNQDAMVLFQRIKGLN